MPVINSNISSLRAQEAMTTNARMQSTAMEQLSTGKRINSAKDDAAGLGLVENMTAQVRGLNQAVRNLNDGINMMQTADGALVESANMLQRMRELAVQSSNATYSSTQRAYLQAEFSALSTQIGRIASETKWNDKVLLSASIASLTVTAGALADGLVVTAGAYPDGRISAAGVPRIASGMVIQSTITIASGTVATGIVGVGTYPTSLTFQAGQSQGQTISVNVGNMGATALGVAGLDILSAGSAVGSISSLDTAIDTVNAQRSTLGATMNQMTYGVDNLTNISTNIAASRSTIQDTDYAQASTILSRGQIVQQAATAMLAQANQQPQSVLALLK